MREEKACMTRLSLAVGIVVGSVGCRVHRAKEQGDAGQEAGGGGGGRKRDGKGRREKMAKGGNKRRSRMSGN